AVLRATDTAFGWRFGSVRILCPQLPSRLPDSHRGMPLRSFFICHSDAERRRNLLAPRRVRSGISAYHGKPHRVHTRLLLPPFSFTLSPIFLHGVTARAPILVRATADQRVRFLLCSQAYLELIGSSRRRSH